MITLVWLLIALPLAGAAVLLLAGNAPTAWGHLLGCAAVIAAFAVGVVLFVDMLGRDAEHRMIHETLFSWVPVGGLQVDFGLQLDQLSMCFVLLITGVGSLIHVYSIGYMADDPERRRFFAYLNLFLAAMLLLVLADNYLGLYVGWEGVGLASYLLIGFWSHKPSAATAAKKAFVVNRVGDVGSGHRDDGHVRGHRIDLVRRCLLGHAATRRGHADRDRSAAAAGGVRQVGAGAAAVLAR